MDHNLPAFRQLRKQELRPAQENTPPRNKSRKKYRNSDLAIEFNPSLQGFDDKPVLGIHEPSV